MPPAQHAQSADHHAMRVQGGVAVGVLVGAVAGQSIVAAGEGVDVLAPLRALASDREVIRSSPA